MSRLTGNDVLELFEAYQAVYVPQELTEEQVWEEVETWVNSLIEEGYDLSDYTWEEMYESYIEEATKPETKGALDTPSPTRVLAKLKGKSGELDKTTRKFSQRDWSQPEGSRYKAFGGK